MAARDHVPGPSIICIRGNHMARDTDSASRARLLKAIAWALFPGFVMGGLVGLVVAGRAGLGPGLSLLAAAVAIAAFTLIVAAVAIGAAEGLGSITGSLLHPRAGKTRSDHSRARSFQARGQWQEAIQIYREAVERDPADFTPHVEIARIFRDGIKDDAEALRWFRTVLRTADPRGAEVRSAARELWDLARSSPTGAMSIAPDLARHRDLCGDVGEAAWAQRCLDELRSAASGG